MTSHSPFEAVPGAPETPILLLCDHASNRVPEEIDLGLPAEDMARHIAYDIGGRGLTLALAQAMSAPAVLSDFSRLVIDPNRGDDDPTLVPKLYDGTIIPGNRHADAAEVARRRDAYSTPYHRAVADEITAMQRRGLAPVIVSIHSFTRQLRGRPSRPWHVGILSARDRRLADPLLDRLAAEPDMVVGDNEPYNGALPKDCMDRHALRAGHLHVLIEVRNDLIEDETGQATWANRLIPPLLAAINAAKDDYQTGS